MNGNILEQDEFVDWNIDMMLEVSLQKEDDFLKIMETLTRIGIPNNRTKSLYQSCHILHKRGRYFIVHFKELYALDYPQGEHTISVEDIGRRTTIARMLNEWGLLKIENSLDNHDRTRYNVKVVKYSDKKNWDLKPKYTIGS